MLTVEAYTKIRQFVRLSVILIIQPSNCSLSMISRYSSWNPCTLWASSSSCSPPSPNSTSWQPCPSRMPCASFRPCSTSSRAGLAAGRPQSPGWRTSSTWLRWRDRWAYSLGLVPDPKRLRRPLLESFLYQSHGGRTSQVGLDKDHYKRKPNPSPVWIKLLAKFGDSSLYQ